MTQEELPYHLIVSKTVAATDALKASVILMDNLDGLYNWLLSNTIKLKDIFLGDRKLYICFSDRESAKEFLSLSAKLVNLQDSKWVKYVDSGDWYLQITLD